MLLHGCLCPVQLPWELSMPSAPGALLVPLPSCCLSAHLPAVTPWDPWSAPVQLSSSGVRRWLPRHRRRQQRERCGRLPHSGSPGGRRRRRGRGSSRRARRRGPGHAHLRTSSHGSSGPHPSSRGSNSPPTCAHNSSRRHLRRHGSSGRRREARTRPAHSSEGHRGASPSRRRHPCLPSSSSTWASSSSLAAAEAGAAGARISEVRWRGAESWLLCRGPMHPAS